MSAIRSSSAAGVARLEVHVRHPHDRLAGEAVGAHAAAGALEPDLAPRSRARTGSRPARRRARSARRGPPRPRRPSGSCRGRPAWWRRRSRSRCSEPKRSEPIAVGRHEAGAGVRGLAPEHAVELDRVADRLVDLQRRAARRPGSASCGRAGRRARCSSATASAATRGAWPAQVERRGSARSRPAPRGRRARRGRSGSGSRRRSTATAAMPPPHSIDALLAERALGARRTSCRSGSAEKRARVRFTPRLGRAARRRPPASTRELLLERHLERVALDRARPLAAARAARARAARRPATAGCASAMASARASAASASALLGAAHGREAPRAAARARARRSPRSRRSRAGRAAPLRVESRSTLERTKRASA